MSTPCRYSLSHLCRSELLGSLARLVQQSHELTAELLAHLAEVDARRLYLDDACSSMFAYCVEILHLSEPAAFRRIHAARAARTYPVIFEMVAQRQLHLTAVTLLAPHLSPDNHEELLRAAVHKSKRQVEQLVAARFPQPDVASSVRKLPGPRSTSTPRSATQRPQVEPPEVGPQTQVQLEGATAAGARLPLGAPAAPVHAAAPQVAATSTPGPTAALAPMRAAAGAAAPAPASPATAPAPAPAKPAAEAAVVAPLAPQRYKVQFTASETMHSKLREAQQLLGYRVPAGDLAQVFERALDALLVDLRKHKYAATAPARPAKGRAQATPARHTTAAGSAPGHASPRPSRAPAQPAQAPAGTTPPHRPTAPPKAAVDTPTPQAAAAPRRSRHIPNQVRREVWKRDRGQCVFVGPDGRRCSQRSGLHFHHRTAWAKGGSHEVSNIELRCAAHDHLAAVKDYGEPFMAQWSSRGGAQVARRAPPKLAPEQAHRGRAAAGDVADTVVGAAWSASCPK